MENKFKPINREAIVQSIHNCQNLWESPDGQWLFEIVDNGEIIFASVRDEEIGQFLPFTLKDGEGALRQLNAEVVLEKLHKHPISGTMIRGYRLGVGDTLMETDVFDSTTGKWERCPVPGLVLQKGANAIWIRPV